MYMDTNFPPGAGRLARFLRLVAHFERDEIEAATDGLIALLDARDGDPDLEPDGDEADVSVVAFGRCDPVYRLTEHRDAMIALASEDDEDDDPAEEDDPPEPCGDEKDVAYREWAPGTSGLFAGGNEDDEDDDSDRCAAGDDHIIAGPVTMRNIWERDTWATGDEHDAERSRSPAYFLDQRRPLFVTAANDWPEAPA